MIRVCKIIGLFFLISVLTSCSIEAHGKIKKDSKKAENSIKDEVSKQALAYVKALQNNDFENAYNMLSKVYIDAGVTSANFKSDLQKSNLNLKGYNVEVLSVRDRLPDEISKNNIGEKFYLVSFLIDSKGKTREDYSTFNESDVKWFNEKIWFHKEKGEWKFFGTKDQEGITWKPDVYEDVLKYVQALQDNDAKTIYSTYSNYFKIQAETIEDISNKLEQSGRGVISYDIKKITDDLNIKENGNVLTPEVKDNLIRVKGGFYRGDNQGLDKDTYTKFEWYFHFENGKWKYLTDDSYNFNNYAISSFLENKVKENQDVVKKEDNPNLDVPVKTDNSGKEIINKITNIKDNQILLGEEYDKILNLLGNPEGKMRNGDDIELKYGDIVLYFNTIYNNPGDNEPRLRRIQRKDIFNTIKEVFSILGEPDDEEPDEELNVNYLKYSLGNDNDYYFLRISENDDDSTISEVSLLGYGED